MTSDRGSHQVRYFSVANAGYFPGVAALVNSLRIAGAPGRLTVLDIGLRPDQRARLGGHCELVAPDADLLARPLLMKPFAARLEPEGMVVIVDSDAIVTGPLDDILRRVAEGAICVYRDLDEERWFAEWSELFALRRPLRRQVYMNTSFVAFSTAHWPHLLERWQEACRRIPEGGGRGQHGPAGPYYALDQDALNAVLMSEVPADAVEEIPAARVAAWLQPLRRTRVLDRRALTCRGASGERTVVLHFGGDPKPWRRDAVWAVRSDAYAVLLPRLLCADDVPVRLEAAELPPWLRLSPGSRALLAVLNQTSRVREFIRVWLIPRIARRLPGRA